MKLMNLKTHNQLKWSKRVSVELRDGTTLPAGARLQLQRGEPMLNTQRSPAFILGAVGPSVSHGLESPQDLADALDGVARRLAGTF